MAAPTALNLAHAGFQVRAWNRTADKARVRLSAEVEVCAEPSHPVAGADAVVTTMLSDGAAVESVMRDGKAPSAMEDSALWRQTSAIGIAATERCSKAAAERGVAFVDAPVLGTKQPAEAGELSVMASGPDECRATAQPYFDAIGSKTLWLGEAGAGSRLKLVVNNWLLALVGGLAETVALAESVGVLPQQFLDVIDGGPLGPAYAQLKGKAMIQRSFEAAFPLVHARKDPALVIEAAEANGLEPRVAKAVRDQFDISIDAGHGDEDMAAAYYASTSGRDTTKGAG